MGAIVFWRQSGMVAKSEIVLLMPPTSDWRPSWRAVREFLRLVLPTDSKDRLPA